MNRSDLTWGTIIVLSLISRSVTVTANTPEKQPAAEVDLKSPPTEENAPQNWRDDPCVMRHPGSYLSVGAGYAFAHTWFVPLEDEFDDKLKYGPFHSWQVFFRVGDAFFEWLALGFQVDMTSGKISDKTVTAGMALLLDATFYPIAGLGIRPSVGLGFSYASGEQEFEFGFGGPGTFSLALTYEFRIMRLLVIAPVAQTYWITGDDYDELLVFFGLEFLKWFDTPTG